jgi:serine/threonine protein kinase
VHRDVKPSNCLLSSSGELRLADFGLGCRLAEGALLTDVVGSHDYLAPEMIRCGHGEAAGYAAPIDLWGAGLTLYMLLCGANPFERDTEIGTLQAILAAQYTPPPAASAHAAAAMRALLTPEPAGRLTAAECLRHAWVLESAASENCAPAPHDAPAIDRPVACV